MASDIETVSRSVCPADGDRCVTEFFVEGHPGPADGVTPIFSAGSTHRYRLHHGEGITCPCECLGRFGCSVARYAARDGSLTLVFYAADYDQLQSVVAELRDRFSRFDIRRLIRSPSSEPIRDSVFVDKEKLTDRQREVLRTAYERGYFDRPRRANATEIAAALSIDSSTFSEHLAVAQKKILQDFFEDSP